MHSCELSFSIRLGVLPLELNKLLIIVVVLSMALTPWLNEIGRKAAEILDEKLQGKEVLANFLSTPLASEDDNLGLPYVAFDLDLGVVKVRVTDLVQAKSDRALTSRSEQSLSLDRPDVEFPEKDQPCEVEMLNDQGGHEGLENEYEELDHDDGVKYCQLESDIGLSSIKDDVEGDGKTGLYSENNEVSVPESCIFFIAYHTVAPHHVVPGPCGEARACRSASLCRVGHVGGPIVREREDVAVR
ncbi:hypothetical protein B296_00009740 [Ensete ventricosum]|uniref:Uncharacterized protein n=1 Tax=Ensete ventricosum TaxID=4639 RepID=A0A427B2J4_ENSVE|nr:hypothetical protein B296_00009740 [Ensete ventricosum]